MNKKFTFYNENVLNLQINSILSHCFRSESDDDGTATAAAEPRVHGVPDHVRRPGQAEEALQDGLAQVSSTLRKHRVTKKNGKTSC